MAGMLDFLGGAGGDNAYSGLLTPDMQNTIRQRQLMGMAQGLLSASGPSRMPVSLGQAFGAGLQGAQQGQDEGLNQAIKPLLLQSQLKKAALEKLTPGEQIVDINSGKTVAKSDMTKWAIGKDALGNPFFYNPLDPNASPNGASGAGIGGGMDASGNSMMSAKDRSKALKELQDISNQQLDATRSYADLSDQFINANKNFTSGIAAPYTAGAASLYNQLGKMTGQNLPGMEAAGEAATGYNTASKINLQAAFDKLSGMKGTRGGLGITKLAGMSGPSPTNTYEANLNINNLAQATKNGAEEQAKLANNWQGDPQQAHALLDEYFQQNPRIGNDAKGNPIPNPNAMPIEQWLARTKGMDITGKPLPAGRPQGAPQQSQPPQGAKQAPDGNYYLPDPNRSGKYLQWRP